MTADVYTHTSAEAERDTALAAERAIYGDFSPVVPNIGQQEQLSGVELGQRSVTVQLVTVNKKGA